MHPLAHNITDKEPLATRMISSNASTFPIASWTGLWSWAVLLNCFQPCVSPQSRLRPAQKSLMRRPECPNGLSIPARSNMPAIHCQS
jgi:hypothetical protein